MNISGERCEGDRVLYIGGFELPDRNAAAQRVVGIAKSLRQLGYAVTFLNALKKGGNQQPEIQEYFGFSCFEYHREAEFDYLFCGNTAISFIRQIQPKIVIAYNYPAFALNRISAFCKKHGIKCISDVTEWYEPSGNPIHKIVKGLDVDFRMNHVLFKMDGIIAISRFLYDRYQDRVSTVLIPPTVDCSDEKWQVAVEKNPELTTFVYAGSPSASKERLDLIVDAVSHAAKQHPVRLNVIGITQEQFDQMYNRESIHCDSICFWGRVDHQTVIELVTGADWAVIMRENSRMVKAGFPTKLVESISCGTPVIVNSFSNICDYLDAHNSIVTDLSGLSDTVEKACIVRRAPARDQFDYHNYSSALAPLFHEAQAQQMSQTDKTARRGGESCVI